MTETPKRAGILFRYALFAERQYQAVVFAAETEQLLHDVKTKTDEVSELDRLIIESSQGQKDKHAAALLGKLEHDRKRARVILEQDSQKYRLHIQKIDVFLQDSVKMFAECLALSDEFDSDIITRLCSLWFRNFEQDEIQPYIFDAISTIPSHKFVFFAHQLAALLSTAPNTPSSTSNAARALQDLVLRLCKEHPFHSLYQLYALWKGDGKSASLTNDRAKARRQAAHSILSQLRGQTREGARLAQVQQICEAYLEWAVYPIPQPSSGAPKEKPTIPRTVKLLSIKAPNIPIPTVPLSVDPTSEYKGIVGIQGYFSRYTTSGGLNLPKINDCKGTDGQHYRQVVRALNGRRKFLLLTTFH